MLLGLELKNGELMGTEFNGHRVSIGNNEKILENGRLHILTIVHATELYIKKCTVLCIFYNLKIAIEYTL